MLCVSLCRGVFIGVVVRSYLEAFALVVFGFGYGEGRNRKEQKRVAEKMNKSMQMRWQQGCMVGFIQGLAPSIYFIVFLKLIYYIIIIIILLKRVWVFAYCCKILSIYVLILAHTDFNISSCLSYRGIRIFCFFWENHYSKYLTSNILYFMIK